MPYYQNWLKKFASHTNNNQFQIVFKGQYNATIVGTVQGGRKESRQRRTWEDTVY